MAEKTVAQKLLVKPGNRVCFIHPPEGYEAILGGLPEGVEVVETPGPADNLVQVFVADRQQLGAELPRLKEALGPKTIL